MSTHSEETTADKATGPIARARAAVAALEVLDRLRPDGASPTAEDLAALRAWPGWGPLAPALEYRPTGTWAEIKERLQWLLDPSAYREAEAATFNAFYTPPEIADACWRILRDLGFTGGTLLEPGCGAGVFMARTPAEVPARWIGVERDPTTARIASLLHPDAQIINQPLQETQLPSRSVDAVLGNVPFGDVAVYDPTAPEEVTTNLHNYFIWRSVQALRPGGVAVLITSRYTLDAKSEEAQAARKAIAADADLLGAIRLPNAALAPGGTTALVDILVLRRRRPGEEPGDDAWLQTRPVFSGQEHINAYLLDHPEQVLGEHALDRAPRYGRTLKVDTRPDDPPLAEALAQAGQRIVERAAAQGRTWQVDAPVTQITAENSPFPTRADGRKEGSFHLVDGVPHEVIDGKLVPVDPKTPGVKTELPRLIRLRDAALRLLEAESDFSTPDEELEPLRAKVRALYEEYVKAHGPLNRYTLVESQPDPETGLPTISRRRPTMGGFRRDPDFVTVLALEDFDDETRTAKPAAILTRRVNRPRQRATHADTPAEAVALCRDELGYIDPPTIARLLGIPVDQVPEKLQGLAFEDPVTRRWVPADEYLSGEVREKLEQAREAAERDPQRWAQNVAALEKVQPKDLEPEQIRANLGAVWIPASDIEDFTAEVFGYRARIWREPRTSTWSVEASHAAETSPAATVEWGTERLNAYRLLERQLNGKDATVYDVILTPDGGERRVRNERETLLAEEKVKAICARFASWVWEDPDRADRLAARYNRLFNSSVLRRFDGSYLTFHGIDPEFTPYPHQKDMVARIIASPAALCPFPVGTGKTAIMFMAAMKLKELGLVRKPMIVTTPSTLEQIARDGKRLFPNARILMASRDELGDARSRKLFAARCATEEWDAVVISHTAFMALPVHPTTEAEYLDRLAAEYRQALATAKQDGGQRRIKQIAKMVKNLETRAKKLLAHSTDDGVFFEQLGVDYLLIDEIHYFKNLAVPVHTDGFSIKPSKRATDLDLKLSWLRRSGRNKHVMAGFSGTMMTNTLLELYVMQHYAQPERLEKLGIANADAWAATYVRFETNPELTPDGRFHLKRRPVDFVNMPELMKIFGEVAELRPKSDFPVKRPKAHRTTLLVDPTPAQRRYLAELSKRVDAIQAGGVDPSVDNMLKICNDGRNIAVSELLVGLEPDGPGKIGAVIDDVAKYYHATKDLPIPGDTSGVTGRLQIVFLSRGTPNKDGSQLYGVIRDGLIKAGVPAEKIRIIHDANTDAKKLALYDDCNSGRVAVLLGSIGKLGVGVNVQQRAARSIIVDPPLRPDEIEQAEGRVWRPGNLNPEVELLRVGTKGTFDAFSYQLLERKQRGIDQLFSGQLTARSIEDIGEVQLSFAQMKAELTGNPLLVKLHEANREVNALLAEAAAHARSIKRLRKEVADHEAQIADKTATATALDAIAAAAAEAPDEAWRDFSGRELPTDDVPGKLAQLAEEALRDGTGYPTTSLSWRGLYVWFTAKKQWREVDLSAWLTIRGQRVQVPINQSWLNKGQHWRILDALTRTINDAPQTAAELRQEADALRERIEQANKLIAKPFPKSAELEAARQRRDELDAQLRQAATEEEAERHRAAVGAASASSTGNELVGAAIHDAAVMAGFDPGTARMAGAEEVPQELREMVEAALRSDPGGGGDPAEQGTESAPPTGDPAADPYPDRAASRAGEDAVRQAFESWRELVPDPATPAELALADTGITVLEETARRRRERLARGRDEDADLDVSLYRALSTAAHALAEQADQSQERIAAVTRIAEAADTHIRRIEATLDDVDSYVRWARSPEPPLDLEPVDRAETPATTQDPAGPAADAGGESDPRGRQDDEASVDTRPTTDPSPVGESAHTEPPHSTPAEPPPTADPAGTQVPEQRPTPPGESPHAAEPEAESGALARFDPIEQAMIRNATEDYASRYYGGPMRFGRDDAARYVAEGHLRDLVDKHGLTPVWNAVASLIAERPEVLDPITEADREQRIRARQDRAGRLADDAYTALLRHDYNRALELIGQAELVDPTYRPSGATWEQIREAIREQRDEAASAGGAGEVAEHQTPTTPVPSSQTAAPTRIVIEHHDEGTLVRGTREDDAQVRRALSDHGFRWSRRLGAWYLPRPWKFDTRTRRVARLRRDLERLGRPFIARTEPSAAVPDAQPDSPALEPQHVPADRFEQQPASPLVEPDEPQHAAPLDTTQVGAGTVLPAPDPEQAGEEPFRTGEQPAINRTDEVAARTATDRAAADEQAPAPSTRPQTPPHVEPPAVETSVETAASDVVQASLFDLGQDETEPAAAPPSPAATGPVAPLADEAAAENTAAPAASDPGDAVSTRERGEQAAGAEHMPVEDAARHEHDQDDALAGGTAPALTEPVPEPDRGAADAEPAVTAAASPAEKTADPAEPAAAEPSPQVTVEPVEGGTAQEEVSAVAGSSPAPELASSMPADAGGRAWKPLSKVEPGDVLEHPGYGFGPFVVREVHDRDAPVVTLVGDVRYGDSSWPLTPQRVTWPVARNGGDPNMRLATPPQPVAEGRPAQPVEAEASVERPQEVPMEASALETDHRETVLDGDEPDTEEPAGREDPLDRAFAGVLALLQEKAAPPADSQGEAQPAATFEDVITAVRRLRSELTGVVPDQEEAIPAEDATVAADAGMTRVLDEVDDAYDQAASRIGRYADTPEWQRITSIRDAARHLWATIRDAAGSYYQEIAADVRARGFLTTMAVRSSRAISHLAWRLADRMSRDGQRDTLAWRAVRRLHRAADRYATRLLFRSDLDRFEDVLSTLRGLRDDLAEATRQDEQPTRRGPRGVAGAVADSLSRLQDAYAAARTRVAAYLGPEWDRITALWDAAGGLWGAAGRPFVRTVLARSCDLIEELSRRLAASPALDEQRDTLARRALVRLSRAAEELAARLRGYLQPGERLDHEAAETAPGIEQPLDQVSYVYAHQGVTARAEHGSTVVEVEGQRHPVAAPIDSLDAFSTQLTTVVRDARPIQQVPRAYWLHYREGSVTVAYQGGETAYLRDGESPRWQRITVPAVGWDAAAFAAAARTAIITRPRGETKATQVPTPSPSRIVAAAARSTLGHPPAAARRRPSAGPSVAATPTASARVRPPEDMKTGRRLR
ncbi:hypothetical protein LI90_4283 [Carbonactinospora thermoautotrophica]|uniref:Helicase ATP-binding domain-containing protein n=1 Tax=Carbonactinospora thermoautotrophica TaxID=1469144 RepID=A0A132N0V1_9ACTN|nr:hypothetical protein [Carbonactinospora thermoautotrophica]KWX03232.1 hypothetical protein LI90_4283 [Carbonactinospora thermoautotrophica]